MFPCPIDCQLSPWTEWGACDASCGPKGTQSRQRRILRQATWDGEQCPMTVNGHWTGEVVEKKPCMRYPCAALERVVALFGLQPARLNMSTLKEVVARHNQTVDKLVAKAEADLQKLENPKSNFSSQVASNNISFSLNTSSLDSPQASCSVIVNGTSKDYPHSWQGPMPGTVDDAACNLCSCQAGYFSCQTKNCIPPNSTRCSHVDCVMEYSWTMGQEVLHVRHHSLEHHGVAHKCVNNYATGECECYCFGGANDIWTPRFVNTELPSKPLPFHLNIHEIGSNEQ